MTRRPLIAANWKMHTPPAGFADGAYRSQDQVEIVVFPTALHLAACIAAGIRVGGQAARSEPHGAFTGDISMDMLKAAGCHYVLCGHSERRQHHSETDADVAHQVTAALAAGLVPVVCVGETQAERDAGRAMDVVRTQVKSLPADERIVLAYEPVWAIGTGKTATPDDAEAMHAFIRSLPYRAETTILYGGSMSAKNAQTLLSQPNIDGGLVGGASLQPAEFAQIVQAAV